MHSAVRACTPAIPALLQAQSNRPYVVTALSIIPFTCSLLPTSACRNIASPPSSVMVCAVSSPLVTSTSATTTRALSWAKAKAMALPIPEPPPVTNTTFPSKRATLTSRAGYLARSPLTKPDHETCPRTQVESLRLSRSVSLENTEFSGALDLLPVIRSGNCHYTSVATD